MSGKFGKDDWALRSLVIEQDRFGDPTQYNAKVTFINGDFETIKLSLDNTTTDAIFEFLQHKISDNIDSLVESLKENIGIPHERKKK